MDKTETGRQPDKEWLTVNEAASYLRMSRATFYVHYRTGRIPGYRLFTDGPLRFKRADLDALFVRDTEPDKAKDEKKQTK